MPGSGARFLVGVMQEATDHTSIFLSSPLSKSNNIFLKGNNENPAIFDYSLAYGEPAWQEPSMMAACQATAVNCFQEMGVLGCCALGDEQSVEPLLLC